MKNGKYSKRRGVASKTLVLALAVMLIVGATIGGTVAWLTAQTPSVTNTFTVGDINITLNETKSDFKMVPGNVIDKDPVVTVVDGSEDCYLFVKIEKSTTLDKYISYTVASGWTELDNVDGVYYRVVNATDRTKSFSVLANDQVTVNEGVTKADMEALKAENATQPTLTFTAYAVQKDNIDTAALAWEKITNPSA